jgi:hypothetical protein
MQNHITLICDRCRATGAPGEEHFESFGDLLDFAPVPRRNERVDGWTPERQRAFIAALAVTGSPRRACSAVGKAQWGADQLRKSDGAEAFNAAWDAALAIAREKGTSRLAANLNAVAHEDEAWSPAAGPWAKSAARSGRRAPPAPPLTPEEEEREKLEHLGVIFKRYVIKLGQEREARLAGRIVAADFYLRQLTHIEVMLDMLSEDGMKLIREFSAGGHKLVDIAETPLSRLLDEARRRKWAELGEPMGPPRTPRDLMLDHGRFTTEPTEGFKGGPPESIEEQERRYQEQHARDAAAQVAWEAEAREDYIARRDSPSATPAAGDEE